jgi:hypothetical protein
MCRRNLIIFVLDQMEKFYKQVALTRPVAKQHCNFFDRRRDKLTPLSMRTTAALFPTRMRSLAKRDLFRHHIFCHPPFRLT